MSDRCAWFRVEIQIPNRPGAEGAGDWFDVTDNIDQRVNVEETAELLDKLNFTLISTDQLSVMRFIDQLEEGMKVRVWFGYIDGQKRLNQDNEMFVGRIVKLEPDFPDNGFPKLTVTAYDPAWVMTRNKPPIQVTHPKNNASATAVDIINDLVKPYVDKGELKIGKIEIPAAFAGQTFDGKATAMVQNQGESDWKFLKRLATGDNKDYDSKYNGLDCLVYVEVEHGEPYLYFVPETTRMGVVSDIELYYPMNGALMPVVQDPTSTSGDMIIESARLEDNPDLADVPIVEVPSDALKNQEDLKLLVDDAGGNVKIPLQDFFDAFDIDYEQIKSDETAGNIKWSLLDFVTGKVGWDDVKKYVTFKIVPVTAGSTVMKSDVPMSKGDVSSPQDATHAIEIIKRNVAKAKKKRNSMGVFLTIQLPEGNTNIRPRRVYNLRNLGGKYSSSDKVRWFADTVTHTIAGSRYTQSIKLIL